MNIRRTVWTYEDRNINRNRDYGRYLHDTIEAWAHRPLNGWSFTGLFCSTYVIVCVLHGCFFLYSACFCHIALSTWRTAGQPVARKRDWVRDLCYYIVSCAAWGVSGTGSLLLFLFVRSIIVKCRAFTKDIETWKSRARTWIGNNGRAKSAATMAQGPKW